MLVPFVLAFSFSWVSSLSSHFCNLAVKGNVLVHPTPIHKILGDIFPFLVFLHALVCINHCPVLDPICLVLDVALVPDAEPFTL